MFTVPQEQTSNLQACGNTTYLLLLIHFCTADVKISHGLFYLTEPHLTSMFLLFYLETVRSSL